MDKIETGVSYFANRWPHHFVSDLEDILAHNCTYIVHTFSENDFLYVRRSMERIFRMTREAGLGCWADPWGVMGLFGGEAESYFLPRNIDACQILNTGQIAPAACPSSEKVRSMMKSWIDAAIDLGADAIFWDEPHFYIVDWDEPKIAPKDAWACRCSRCQAGYRNVYGMEMPIQLTPEVRDFRQNQVMDFLLDMTGYVHAKGIQNTLCLLPVGEGSVEALPWEQVAQLPGVTVLGTDPYWFLHGREVVEFVTERTRQVVAVCQPRGIVPQIWVEGGSIPMGREHELELGLNTAVKEGATSLAVWGYRGGDALYTGPGNRPAVVWETIGRTFGKLRSMSTP